MKNICLVIAVAVVFSCDKSQTNQEQVLNFDPQKDYFDEKVSVDYATNFTVSYHKHYKVVRTHARLSSWEGNGEEIKEDVLVLLQRGTPAPSLSGDLENATVIPIPAERAAVNIQNGEVFVDELGLSDKLVAIGGAISYDDAFRQKVLDGNLSQIGYSWHQPANLEILLEERTDLFFMGLSNLDFADTMDKSRELGIPTAPVFEWAERDYLGRTEWIKFYSLFFNAEAAANQKFDDIVARVDDIRKLTADIEEKPSMVWAYYAGRDRWAVHRNSIETQFMKDVGVQNILEDSARPTENEGEPMSSEEFLTRARKTAHWMIGDLHSAPLPSENYLSLFDSWNSGKLYHNMKRSKPEANAFDWYGRAVVRPDLILADLVTLIHPQIELNHELYFMDRFDKSMELPPKKSETLYH